MNIQSTAMADTTIVMSREDLFYLPLQQQSQTNGGLKVTALKSETGIPSHHDVILCPIPPIEVAAIVAQTVCAQCKFRTNKLPGTDTTGETFFKVSVCMLIDAASRKGSFAAVLRPFAAPAMIFSYFFVVLSEMTS